MPISKKKNKEIFEDANILCVNSQQITSIRPTVIPFLFLKMPTNP